MSKSNRLKIVIGVMFAVGLISFLIHLFNSRDIFDVNRIDINDINAILIKDGGIKGHQMRLISDKNTTKNITSILKQSRVVNWHNINVKANQGECTVTLVHQNKKETTFRIIKTTFSGVIIESGDYTYQNNQLLGIIIKQLK